MGRFLSPDDVGNDTEVVDPQRSNLYAYVRNNPIKYLDESGEEIKYASPALETVATAVRTESSLFDEALKGYEGEGAPDLTIGFGEAGTEVDKEGEYNRVGLAKVGFVPERYDYTNYPDYTVLPRSVSSAEIVIDESIEGSKKEVESTLKHEVGDVHHARTSPEEYSKQAEETKQNPRATKHADRPQERIAKKFAERVKKEQKAYKEKLKEEKKKKKKLEGGAGAAEYERTRVL